MANTKIAVKIENYNMKDGGDGPAACLEKDGNYSLSILKAELKETDDKNRYYNISYSVNDDDAKGSVVYQTLWLDGNFQSGAQEGQPRVKQVLDLLTSGNMSGRVNEITKSGEMDLAQVATEIKGLTVYARVVQSVGNDGKTRSQPIYFLRQAKYEESRKTGINFRTAPTAGRAQAAKSGTGSVGTKANGVASPRTGVVTDQLSSEV